MAATEMDETSESLINTDFSAKIKTNPSQNTKNDVVWATGRDQAGDKLESREDKYSVGVYDLGRCFNGGVWCHLTGQFLWMSFRRTSIQRLKLYPV